MAQSRRPSTELLVGTVLISLNTLCVGLGAGDSELGVGNSVDIGGKCTACGGGGCEEVFGDGGDGVHVTGGLVEGVCFFCLAFLLNTETGGGSMLDLGG